MDVRCRAKLRATSCLIFSAESGAPTYARRINKHARTTHTTITMLSKNNALIIFSPESVALSQTYQVNFQFFIVRDP